MTKEELHARGISALLDDLDAAIRQQYDVVNVMTAFLTEDRSMDIEYRGKIIGLALDINNLIGAEKALIAKAEELENADL